MPWKAATRLPEPLDLIDNNLNPNVLTANDAWMMWSVLQDVVKRGTATKALSLGRSDIAGKTGTTNNQHDAWFVGMGGPYVSSVWCGYDQLKSLNAYGSTLALPIWIDFMKIILENQAIFVINKPSVSNNHLDSIAADDPSITEFWMDGNENDDWVNPDQEEIMREIL